MYFQAKGRISSSSPTVCIDCMLPTGAGRTEQVIGKLWALQLICHRELSVCYSSNICAPEIYVHKYVQL